MPKAGSRSVVVAGDVTIDWNLARVRATHGRGAVWNAEDCTRASHVRGGAALLGDLITAVAGDLRQRRGLDVAVQAARQAVSPALPTDPRFHHSYAMWALFSRDSESTDPSVWRVDEFLGLDRGRQTAPPRSAPATRHHNADAGLVVVDDAGLGFRDQPLRWPAANAVEPA